MKSKGVKRYQTARVCYNKNQLVFNMFIMFDKPSTNNALHNSILDGELKTPLSLEQINSLSLGNTPLLLALKTGRMDVASALIEAGANLNIPDERGLYPLHFAALFRQDNLIKQMIARGAIASGPISAADLYAKYWGGLSEQITTPNDCVDWAPPLVGKYFALTDVARFHLPLVAIHLVGSNPKSFISRTDPLDLIYTRGLSTTTTSALYLSSRHQFYYNFRQSVKSVTTFRDNLPTSPDIHSQLKSTAVLSPPVTPTEDEQNAAIHHLEEILSRSVDPRLAPEDSEPLLNALNRLMTDDDPILLKRLKDACNIGMGSACSDAAELAFQQLLIDSMKNNRLMVLNHLAEYGEGLFPIDSEEYKYLSAYKPQEVDETRHPLLQLKALSSSSPIEKADVLELMSLTDHLAPLMPEHQQFFLPKLSLASSDKIAHKVLSKWADNGVLKLNTDEINELKATAIEMGDSQLATLLSLAPLKTLINHPHPRKQQFIELMQQVKSLEPILSSLTREHKTFLLPHEFPFPDSIAPVIIENWLVEERYKYNESDLIALIDYATSEGNSELVELFSYELDQIQAQSKREELLTQRDPPVYAIPAMINNLDIAFRAIGIGDSKKDNPRSVLQIPEHLTLDELKSLLAEHFKMEKSTITLIYEGSSLDKSEWVKGRGWVSGLMMGEEVNVVGKYLSLSMDPTLKNLSFSQISKVETGDSMITRQQEMKKGLPKKPERPEDGLTKKP